MIQKVYKKLTEEQKARGIIFSSCLSTNRTELETDTIHEVNTIENDKSLHISRLKDIKFFRDSHYRYCIERT